MIYIYIYVYIYIYIYIYIYVYTVKPLYTVNSWDQLDLFELEGFRIKGDCNQLIETN